MSKTRVLITDDSPLIRKMLVSTLQRYEGFEVVGEAKNGLEAIEMTKAFKPDVITMDVEMPRCNGLEALEAIMSQCPTPVMMLSSLTAHGAKETIKALELGAFEFMQKPEDRFLGFAQLEGELIAKLRSWKDVRLGRGHAKPVQPAPLKPVKSDYVVVIASSTGGPKALTVLFNSLPKGFPAPILIAQHMPAGFTKGLADRLDGFGVTVTLEAAHGMAVLPGQCLVAPGQKHMTVKNGHVELNEEPTLHGVRPAADYLFMSAAKQYGKHCIGVVLTGMGRDGAEGAHSIVKAGGYTIGEAESTCTVYGMPKAAYDRGGISQELPIQEIGGELLKLVTGEKKNAA